MLSIWTKFLLSSVLVQRINALRLKSGLTMLRNISDLHRQIFLNKAFMESLKNKKDAHRTNVLMISNQQKPLNNIKFTSSIVEKFLLNLQGKG